MTHSLVDRTATTLPTFRQSLLYCLPPLIALAIVGYPLSDWLVDDAGISFAYARNLAHGAGLVSQPGKIPVEGFSNPLWTLLFVPGYWVSANAHLVLAKLLGYLFSFGVFVVGFHIVVRLTRSPLFGVLAMIFLALNTSFAVWALSGLENSLYAFEVACLAYLGLVTLERLSWRVALCAGLVAAAAALTRPEGILFAALWPGALFVRVVRDRRLARELVRPASLYAAAAVLPYVAYKAMAVLYFGSLLPNTYFARGAPGFDVVGQLLRLDEVARHKMINLLAGPFGFAWLTIAVFVLALGVCIAARRFTAPLTFLVGATRRAYLVFILLPIDWMDEFRFGTPFLVLFYPTLFSLVWVAGDLLPAPPAVTRQFPAFLTITVLAIPAIFAHQVRFERFYHQPTLSIARVSDLFGERFNRAAHILGVERASFLLPDIGGTLLESELEIYDLAGLADATIARTLWTDKEALRGYIFNHVNPTFILTYAYSTLATDLDADPLFRLRYVALYEAPDEVASTRAGRTVLSGDYVRRDVVAGRPDALAEVRAFLYGDPPIRWPRAAGDRRPISFADRKHQ